MGPIQARVRCFAYVGTPAFSALKARRTTWTRWCNASRYVFRLTQGMQWHAISMRVEVSWASPTGSLDEALRACLLAHGRDALRAPGKLRVDAKELDDMGEFVAEYAAALTQTTKATTTRGRDCGCVSSTQVSVGEKLRTDAARATGRSPSVAKHKCSIEYTAQAPALAAHRAVLCMPRRPLPFTFVGRSPYSP